MKKVWYTAAMLCGFWAWTAMAAETTATEGPSHVTVQQTADGWELRLNSQPYFIRGAGARMYLEPLARAGANSIRTWDAAYIDALLNKAHQLGLTVTIGLWMGQERNGFDYTDRKAVERQLNKARRHVNKYKDHPALLMWGIGNEAEWITGTNILVYKAINDIAEMIKQTDTNHPTMTVLAGIDPYGNKISNLKQYCPAIDIVGVNSFGGLRSLPQRLKKAGWDGPYAVTEFGPLGPWETARTAWGAEQEPTSTEKGKFCFVSYMKGIHRQPRCLGSYAFYWGYKMETTPTWFSMILQDGRKTAAVDYMTACWKRRWPTNRCPEVDPIQSRADGERVRGGGRFEAELPARDPEGDTLTYAWSMMSEHKHPGKGGITNTVLKPVHGCIMETNGSSVVFTAPTTPGAYRLFGYVYDRQNGAAAANMPFYAE